MAKGARYWLVTVCITLLRVRNGYTKTDKIVEGTLNTSEVGKISYHTVTEFQIYFTKSFCINTNHRDDAVC